MYNHLRPKTEEEIKIAAKKYAFRSFNPKKFSSDEKYAKDAVFEGLGELCTNCGFPYGKHGPSDLSICPQKALRRFLHHVEEIAETFTLDSKNDNE